MRGEMVLLRGLWSWTGLFAALCLVLLLAPVPAGGGPAGTKQTVVAGYPPFNPANDGGGPYTSGVWIDNIPNFSYRNGGSLDTRVNARYLRWDFSGIQFPGVECPSHRALKDSGDTSHDAVMRMVPYVPGAFNDGSLAESETVKLHNLPIGQAREFYLNTEVVNDQAAASEISFGTNNGLNGFSSQVARLTKSSWKFTGAGMVRTGCPDVGVPGPPPGPTEFVISFEITISE